MSIKYSFDSNVWQLVALLLQEILHETLPTIKFLLLFVTTSEKLVAVLLQLLQEVELDSSLCNVCCNEHKSL